jgi:exonuclease SbcD
MTHWYDKIGGVGPGAALAARQPSETDVRRDGEPPPSCRTGVLTFWGMRILHTSDWHVGRTFHGRDLLAEQEAVLGGLADVVAAAGVDTVVVAGDVFDRAMPSTDAVRVCHRVLARIRAAGAQLMLISGNHDSAGRLGFGAEFMAASGVHVRTAAEDVADPVLLADEHGPVAVYGLPYLEPETARHVLGEPELRGHEAVLDVAMSRVRADLADRPAGTRSVVVAHAFVVGGAACDSERVITVGGVETVPAGIFDGPDYVALGHLHGAQQISERIRYAGSPLAYSFSESEQVKSAWLVDLGPDGLAGVRRHRLPVPRRLAVLTGELVELLDDPGHEAVRDHYVAAVLTDRIRPIDAMRRLQDRFPYAVHLDWRPSGRDEPRRSYTQRVIGRDDLEVATEFLAHVRGEQPSEEERGLFRKAFEAVRLGEAVAGERQR